MAVSADNRTTDEIKQDLTVASQPYLKVHDSFKSYDEFSQRLKTLSEATFQHFSIGRAEKFPGGNANFKYVRLTLHCKQGIRKQTNSKGIRKNQETFSTGCKSFINCRYRQTDNVLCISDAFFEHNHEVSQFIYSRYPENRRLPEEGVEFLRDVNDLQPNKKLLTDHLRTKYGKNVTARDLSNRLASGIKDPREVVSDSLNILEKHKNLDPESHVKVVSNEETGTIELIFYQSSVMKKWYNAFPELLQIDGTYRLNDSNYVLYLFTIIDGNGISRIVSWAFLSQETEEHVRLCFEQFELANFETVPKTEVILLDKDFESVKCANETFKVATVLLCQVHADRNFCKIVRELKLTPIELQALVAENMSVEQLKNEITALLRKLMYCRSLEVFEETWKTFLDDRRVPADFKEKFAANWYSCRSMWARAFRKTLKTFGINDTNRIESQNKHIKDVIQKYCSMSKCIEGLFIFCASHYFNIDQREFLSKCKIKKTLSNETSDSTVSSILHHFSEFGARQLLKEYRRFIERPIGTNIDYNGAEICVEYPGSSLHTVTGSNFSVCTCEAYCNFDLPCKHIFAARQLAGLPIFDLQIVSSRFQRRHLMLLNDVCTTFEPSDTISSSSFLQNRLLKKTNDKKLSAQEKYCKMLGKCKQICDLSSKCSNSEFHERLSLVEDLFEFWNSGKKVILSDTSGAMGSSCALEPGESLESKLNNANKIPILDTGDLLLTKIDFTSIDPGKCDGGDEGLFSADPRHRRVIFDANEKVNDEAVVNLPNSGASKQPIDPQLNIVGTPLSFRKQWKPPGKPKGVMAPQRTFHKREKADLSLSSSEKEGIQYGNNLPASVMSKAASLMRTSLTLGYPQEPGLGLQSKKFHKIRGSFVQIIKFENTYLTVQHVSNGNFNIFSAKKLALPDDNDENSPFANERDIFVQAASILDSPSPLRNMHFTLWPVTESDSPREQALVALACAVDLCRGNSPCMKVYKLGSHITKHVLHGFEQKQFNIFPFSRNVVKALPKKITVKIYCICRLPDNFELKMIECGECKEWFHADCLSLSTTDDPWNCSNIGWVCPTCENSPSAKKQKIESEIPDDALISPPPGLTLIPFGNGTLGRNKDILVDTCTIDSCLMPFHARNCETNGLLEKSFKVHSNPSVQVLGAVLSLAREGLFFEAKVTWARHINLPCVYGMYDFNGNLDATFIKFFNDLWKTSIQSLCSNSSCDSLSIVETFSGITFDRFIGDLVEVNLQTLIDLWSDSYRGPCNSFSFEKTVNGTKVVDLSRNCTGMRTFHSRILPSDIPPFLIFPTGDLRQLSHNLPNHLMFYGAKFELLGVVYLRPNHFHASLRYKDQIFYFNDLSAKLRLSMWDEDVSSPVVAIYLNASL